MKRIVWSVLLVLMALSLSPTLVARTGSADSNAPGAVYTMTNDPTDNEVVVFDRDAQGFLMKVDEVSTQGLGSGGGVDPLASQGSIALTENGKWLLVVNAGSDDVTVFAVDHEGLSFAGRYSSGGAFPVSLTLWKDTVYVLNAGTPNIAGFWLSKAGELTPIAGSTRTLGAGDYAQVGFDNHGRWLVVTDKSGNRILVFPVSDGVPSASPVISPSNGTTPFALIFDQRDRLLVVEVNDGNGAVSSYNILSDGSLETISASVASGQNAACWIVGNARGNVFTTNPGSSSISSYQLDASDGSVALLEAVAGVATAALDASITSSGRFLYALDPAEGGIDIFRIGAKGGLTSMGTAPGELPIYAQGLAVR